MNGVPPNFALCRKQGRVGIFDDPDKLRELAELLSKVAATNADAALHFGVHVRTIEGVLERLRKQQRVAAYMQTEGATVQEASSLFSCSQRFVERVLAQIKAQDLAA